MELKKIPYDFTVCKVSHIPDELMEDPFCFIGKTDQELSLVCITEHAPASVIAREDGWNAIRIQGVLDFSLIGILAPILQLLADNGIGIFAVSTFNTDYILVKQECCHRALEILAANGYTIAE